MPTGKLSNEAIIITLTRSQRITRIIVPAKSNTVSTCEAETIRVVRIAGGYETF